MNQNHTVLNSLLRAKPFSAYQAVRNSSLQAYTADFIHFVALLNKNFIPLSTIKRVVLNPSMHIEKINRPVHSASCYDNANNLLQFGTLLIYVMRFDLRAFFLILLMFGIPAKSFSAYDLSQKGCVHQM